MYYTTFGLMMPFVIIMQLLFPIMFWVIFVKIILTARRNIKNASLKSNNIFNDTQTEKYTDISNSKLSELNVGNIDDLKDYLYNIFYNFENAYNDLDYNEMRSLCTKKIYQDYKTGVSVDLKLGNKRIIKGICRKNVVIYDIFSSSAKQVIYTMIEIEYLSYTQNKNGKIISGNQNEKRTEKFEVEFKKEFNDLLYTNCPNCGATLKDGVCSYCKTSTTDSDFKISSIKRIIDKK